MQQTMKIEGNSGNDLPNNFQTTHLDNQRKINEKTKACRGRWHTSLALDW